MRDERSNLTTKSTGSVRTFTRRAALKAGMALGAVVGLSESVLGGQDKAAALRPQAGDWLVGVGDAGLTPLSPDAIPTNSPPTMAWAMEPQTGVVRSGSRLNRVLLLRFETAALAEDTRARAADGVVAYTAICTHNGCDVTEWLGDEQALACPCHTTKFDPRNGARVLDGPAPRPLPALPLAVAEGRLVVSRSFTTRVGFELA